MQIKTQTDYYSKSAKVVLSGLVSSSKGLSLAEAEYRLQRDGANVLHNTKEPSKFTIFSSDLWSLILTIAALISIFEKSYFTGFIICLVILLNIKTSLLLNKRRYHFINHMQKLFNFDITVVRNGKRLVINSKELVKGDIASLTPGQVVPADLRIISSSKLTSDDHEYTGSNLPISKTSNLVGTFAEEKEVPRNMLLSGSHVLGGEGLGVVVATGKQTLLAKRTYNLAATILPESLKYSTKKLKYILISVLTVVIIGLSITAASLHTESQMFWSLLVLVLISAIPMALNFNLASINSSTMEALIRRRSVIQHILSISLGNTLATMILAVGGIVSVLAYHIPAPLVAIQVIVLELIIMSLPIVALGSNKLGQSEDLMVLDKYHIRRLFKFSLAAGFLSFGNYLLFFIRHNVSVSYMNPQNYIYHQATTLSLLTLVICQFINVLYLRVNEQKDKSVANIFANNKTLVRAFVGALALVCILIYVPWIRNYTGTYTLDLGDWLTALGGGALFGLLRLAEHQTIKHSRHAVIKLHHELGLSNLLGKISSQN